MKVPSSSPGDAIAVQQIAHWRHELLTPLNHILGLTELQLEEAAENGLQDYVPALTEINARGRALLGMVETGVAPFSSPSDLKCLAERLQSEAGRTIPGARKLSQELRAIDPAAADDLELVSRALENLISISREID